MADVVGTRAASQRPFLEHHYYKGGLRTDFYGVTVERPLWAPPAEAVGFRDEVGLDHGDFVVELAKFRYAQDAVTWIGVYQASTDEVYGNRRNHAGLGVWLLNLAPVEPSIIIDALSRSLQVFIREGERATNSNDSARPLLDFIDAHLAAYAQLPDPLGGLAPSSGLALESVKYVSGLEGEARDRHLDELFFRLLYLKSPSPDACRALVLLTEPTREQAAFDRGFTVASSLNFKGELLASLPKAFGLQDAEIQSLRATNHVQEKACEALDLRVDTLERALTEQQERATLAEQECAALRGSLEGNDEHKRYASLLDAISDQSRQFSQLSRDLASIQSELRTLRSDVKGLQHHSPLTQYPQPRNDPAPARITHTPVRDEIDWKAVATIALVILVVIALGYVSYLGVNYLITSR
jgi:hypothetical protein